MKPTFEADFEKSNGIPDATRVVGAEDGSDPTLTHGALSREEKWGMSPNKSGECALTREARGDGYFSSRRPPTLLSKVRRTREVDQPASVKDDSKSEERARKRKNEEERREARRIEDEARARRVADLDEAMGQRPLPEDLNVIVEKSNVLVVYVLQCDRANR